MEDEILASGVAQTVAASRRLRDDMLTIAEIKDLVKTAIVESAAQGERESVVVYCDEDAYCAIGYAICWMDVGGLECASEREYEYDVWGVYRGGTVRLSIFVEKSAK